MKSNHRLGVSILSQVQPAAWTRRKPEETVLYQVVTEHLATFVAQLEADPSRLGLPLHVRREFERYLDCGLLCRGFCRVFCESCGRDELVAWACRGRGFCPSCGGRRMAEQAAHLVDHVLPDVPVRQWVLSLPYSIRFLIGYRPELCKQIRGIFIRAVMSFYQRRARDRGTPASRTGSVVATQRFDSALRVDVHFHALVLDGVYTDLEYGESPRFHAAEKPTDAELDWLVRHLHALIVGHLQRAGYLTEDVQIATDSIDENDPLVHCHAAAIQGKIAFGQRRGQPVSLSGKPIEDLRPPSAKKLCADFAGFSLHAAVRIPAGEVHRPRLERLARYVCRPPIAKDRLSLTKSGYVVYKFKKPWRNGREAVVMDPLTFLSRLAALVPFKRQHLLTYHGVLAPAASARDRIVPAADVPSQVRSCGKSHDGVQADASNSNSRSLGQGTPQRYIPWAELLRRVFLNEVLTCPFCAGKRRVLSMVRDPDSIHRILSHLGLDPRPPPRAPPGFVQGELQFV